MTKLILVFVMVYFSSADKEPPIIRCSNETFKQRAHWASNVNYPDLVWPFLEIFDNWGQVVSILCNPRRFRGIPIGSWISTCTAYDDAGNNASCDTSIEILGKKRIMQAIMSYTYIQ